MKRTRTPICGLFPGDGNTPPRRLTTAKGKESSPAWSPDGARVAFSAKREGDEASQIYVIDVVGGEARHLVEPAPGSLWGEVLAGTRQSEKRSATVSVALFRVSPNSWCGRFQSPFGAPARVQPTRRRDADGSGRDDRAPHLQLHRSGLGGRMWDEWRDDPRFHEMHEMKSL